MLEEEQQSQGYQVQGRDEGEVPESWQVWTGQQEQNRSCAMASLPRAGHMGQWGEGHRGVCMYIRVHMLMQIRSFAGPKAGTGVTHNLYPRLRTKIR